MESLKSGAAYVSNSASSATGSAQNATASGTDKWNAMSEEQKKQTFDSLPEEKKQGKSYMEWIQEGYQHQKENWMPWIEDLYLRWFTNDNKASYATKGQQLSKVLPGCTTDAVTQTRSTRAR